VKNYYLKINGAKLLFVLPIFFGLLFSVSCFQQLQNFEVKSNDDGIIFTHPKIEEAFKQNNTVIFGEINVSRRNKEGKSEEMWNAQSTSSGFSQSTEALKKPYIIYAETIPQTRVFTEAKPLEDGKYQVTGIIGIYDQNRKLLDDLNLAGEFTVKTDETGKKTIVQ
jgi:hypothetical protein